MRLPGTRYQEHGWEQVRKLLGHCSLQAFAHGDAIRQLDGYVDAMAELLRDCARSARAEAPGNSYGDSVLELSLSLVYELQARPADWDAFLKAAAGDFAPAPALRKKINDMYAVLRDKVDSDNYQAACGRPCSANRIYTFRMLDTAYNDIAQLFGGWQGHRAQVGAILGRELDAMPIEVRQMSSIGACKAEWVIGWSASLEQFAGSPGPLHTRSKRFASLKNSPAKIQAMLAEIGDYEELSSNRDQEWLLDADEASGWLEDYWRVLDDAGAAPSAGPDQLLLAAEDDPDEIPPDAGIEEGATPGDMALAASVSLPPGFIAMARQAQDRAGQAAHLLAGSSLPVRLAVCLKVLGPFDDSYPDDWLDPASGELPTMQQLAQLDQVSLPTLRKRRDEAIARLQAAPRP